MKKWILKQPDSQIEATLVKETGLSPFFCSIIAGRNLNNRAEAEDFFNSNEFADPLEIADMAEAVEVIRNTVDSGEKITVYGDYDCDGVTSTVMLYNYLCAIGGEADWYIPERSEGYGMNSEAVRKLAANGTKLIITVDNGISAIAEAELIAELGMQLVITDHHQPSEELPKAAAIVNPHRKDDKSKFKDLAGCGVALKLIMALEEDSETILEQFADLAAIGTIGDIVPLTGENRRIVSIGLQNMFNTENIGLMKLLQKSGVKEENLSATTIAFSLVPRINAAGRCGSPSTAAEMLIEENPSIAALKADEICALNDRRKNIQENIIKEALAQANDEAVRNRRLMIVCGKNWDHGVIGLAAANLLEKFGKPTIVITDEGEFARGSCRSVEGFHMFELLSGVGDILVKFGGHAKAGGFTIETARIDEFIAAAEKYAAENYPVMPPDSFFIDKELTAADATIENIEMLEKLEPFGEANPLPFFLMKNVKIISKKPLKDGKFFSFNGLFGGNNYRIVCFKMSYNKFWYSVNDIVDIVVNVEINEYNDNRSVVMKLHDVRLSGFNQDKFFNAKAAYEALARQEKTDPRLISRIIPQTAQLRQTYDIIKSSTYLSQCEAKAISAGINYCMFKVILDVFAEFSLVEIDTNNDIIKLLPAKGKADFSKSSHLASLKAQIEKGV